MTLSKFFKYSFFVLLAGVGLVGFGMGNGVQVTAAPSLCPTGIPTGRTCTITGASETGSCYPINGQNYCLNNQEFVQLSCSANGQALSYGQQCKYFDANLVYMDGGKCGLTTRSGSSIGCLSTSEWNNLGCGQKGRLDKCSDIGFPTTASGAGACISLDSANPSVLSCRPADTVQAIQCLSSTDKDKACKTTDNKDGTCKDIGNNKLQCQANTVVAQNICQGKQDASACSIAGQGNGQCKQVGANMTCLLQAEYDKFNCANRLGGDQSCNFINSQNAVQVGTCNYRTTGGPICQDSTLYQADLCNNRSDSDRCDIVSSIAGVANQEGKCVDDVSGSGGKCVLLKDYDAAIKARNDQRKSEVNKSPDAVNISDKKFVTNVANGLQAGEICAEFSDKNLPEIPTRATNGNGKGVENEYYQNQKGLADNATRCVACKNVVKGGFVTGAQFYKLFALGNFIPVVPAQCVDQLPLNLLIFVIMRVYSFIAALALSLIILAMVIISLRWVANGVGSKEAYNVKTNITNLTIALATILIISTLIFELLRAIGINEAALTLR